MVPERYLQLSRSPFDKKRTVMMLMMMMMTASLTSYGH